MRIFQAGGYRGSMAGDCGAIASAGWAAVVDIGRTYGGDVMGAHTAAWLRDQDIRPDRLVISHYHTDHASTDGRHGLVRRVDGNGGVLHDFTCSQVEAQQARRAEVHRGISAARQRVTQRDRAAVTRVADDDLAELWTLAPANPDAERPADENVNSGGVCARTVDGSFAFVSLGDMAESDPTLAALERVLGERPPRTSVVKLPHHASGGNFTEGVRRLLRLLSGEGRRVYALSSGHSLGGMDRMEGLEAALEAGATQALVLTGPVREVRAELALALRNIVGRREGRVALTGAATLAVSADGEVTLSTAPWRWRARDGHVESLDAVAIRLDRGELVRADPYGRRGLVVVDPAHGGHRDRGKSRSRGVLGSGGVAAKDATLRFSRALAGLIPSYSRRGGGEGGVSP
jgi:N-acetylmuramoyl-L-alanine amidase